MHPAQHMQPLHSSIEARREALAQFLLTLTDDVPGDLHLLEILRVGVGDALGWLEECLALCGDVPPELLRIHRLMDLADERLGETLTPDRLSEILLLSRRSPAWKKWLTAARSSLAALTECHTLSRTRLREAWADLMHRAPPPEIPSSTLNSNRCPSHVFH